MYTTGARSIVYAFDARNGKLLWKYDPQVPQVRLGKGCCDIVNRGVAVWDGKVYVATYDGRLIALDARNGKQVWSVSTIVDPLRPYTITGAPRVVKGKVIIGNGGAELGVRGYITAYDAKSGRQAWRFYTVPGNPAKPFESPAMKMAAATWTGDQWWIWGGGGTAWDSIAYDPELNLLYIGVGNGSPWNRTLRSPNGGDNLFLSSIVALNPDTGAICLALPDDARRESWDYTATQHMILADLTIDGRPRKVLMQAPKNGFFYVLDRKTGKLISAETFSKVTWATHVDMKTGRPGREPGRRRLLEGAEAHVSRGARRAQLASDGVPPGHGPRLHPRAGSAVPVHQPAGRALRHEGRLEHRRRRSAIHPRRWRPRNRCARCSRAACSRGTRCGRRRRGAFRYKTPGNGGVLATAGNLVFQGTADGRFVAYSADKGETAVGDRRPDRRDRRPDLVRGRRRAIHRRDGRIGRRRTFATWARSRRRTT